MPTGRSSPEVRLTRGQRADRRPPGRVRALLDLADANPYTARAYRRAAETIRGGAVPSSRLGRAGRVRELRGIGPGIEARLRELSRPADRRAAPSSSASSCPARRPWAFLGLTRTLRRDRAGSRCTTPDEFREAVAAGGCAIVPGIGPKTRRRCVVALACVRAAAGRGRARPGAGAGGGIAARWTVIPRADPRRWATPASSSLLSARPPIRRPARALCGAAADRGRVRAASGAGGVDRGGRADRARGGGAGALRHRARARDRIGGLRRGARAAARRADRGGVSRRWHALVPPELREPPFRGEPPALVERERSAATSTATRPGPTAGSASRRWIARARARLRVPRDLRPHACCGRGAGPDGRRRARQARGDRGRERARSRPFGSCAESSATSCRTGRSTFPTTCSPSSTGCRRACTAGSACRAGAHRRSRRRCGTRHVRCLSHPKGRIIDRRPENALDLERVFEVALEHGVALEVNGLPTGSTSAASTSARHSERVCRSSAPPTLTR